MEQLEGQISVQDMREKFNDKVVGKAIASVAADEGGVVFVLMDGTEVFVIGQIVGMGIREGDDKVVVN